MEWPEWWSWELEFTPHLLKRMVDRQFNEVELRHMLEAALSWHKNHEDGRCIIETTHHGRPWAVVVEPISNEQVVIVITAYPLD